ncbi:MAG: DNA (cytosine-5-)-methyltransferase [Clostridiales bacterium]|nr:DNA (cytosine-5-)-methyltransferase [Clostridiales bacterium]
MNNQITSLGSLFDGIGGFPYAASFYGIRPLWASEILPQAVSVTMRHFPDMEHVGDITALDGAKLPPVDIITFGSPCQDLSTAGRRLGLQGERSGLFTEAIRIIDEMRRATNGKYPRYALWENVPGAMSSGKPAGSDFRAVLEAFAKTEIPMPASGRWANAGMVRGCGTEIAWRVLNAQHFGVPQRRRRIFLICDFGGESAGEILFIEKGMRGHPAPGSKARQATSPDASGGVGDAGESIAFACNQRDEVRDLHDVSAAICAQPGMKQQTFIAENCLNPWDTQQSRVFTEDGTSPTLVGADGGGGRNPAGLVFCAASSQSHAGIAEELAGALTCQHEQPFICEPETARTLTARGDSSPCADRGQNVVAVSVHQNGTGELSVANTTKSLTTMSTSSCRNAPLVACGFDLQQITSKENRSSLKEVQPTLCAGGNPHVVASEPDLRVAYALQGNMIGRQHRNGPNGSGISENLSFTLTATDTPAVAAHEPIPIQDKATRCRGGGPTRNGDGAGNGLGVGKPVDPAPTMTAGDHHAVAAVDCRNYKETGDLSGTLQAKNKPGYSLNYQNPVRAGYIVRRLTPIECERLQGFPDGWTRFGHDGKEISDTRRYQMLGNSVAVPCVAFIMNGIVSQIQCIEKEVA